MATRLQLKIGGRWLRETCSWGDLTYSYAWPGGCDQASFEITSRYSAHPPSIVGNARAEIYRGIRRIWAGPLSEPDWNGRQATIRAAGLSTRGDGYMAFDGSGNTTDDLTVALTQANLLGDPLGWSIGTGIPSGPLNADGDGTTGPLNSINALADAWATKLGRRWMVDANNVITMAADPTTPTLHVRSGAVDQGTGGDNFASHVLLRHVTLAGTYRTAAYPALTDPPNAYERLYGHKEYTDDSLVDQGPMADATADAIAQAVYLGSKQRPGWTNAIEVGYGQLLTSRGQRVDPAVVGLRPVMVQVHGVRDQVTSTPYVNFVAGQTLFTEGSNTVQITPVDLVARDPETVQTEIIAAMIAAGYLKAA